MELVRRRPREALAPYVRELVGWRDDGGSVVVRREPPGDLVPLIINFGSPVRIFADEQCRRFEEVGSFTTGLYDRCAIVGTAPGSGGLQVNLTVAGARLWLGQPLGPLVNRAVSLDALFGRMADDLASRLHDTTGWPARFDLVEELLQHRIASVRPPSPLVMRALRQLRRSGGQVPIATLVREAGCSQKHLVAQFRDELGVTPKVLARVVRFGRALTQVSGGTPLSDVALRCGYYDQAHLDREFRALAGLTPSRCRDAAAFIVASDR